MLTKILTGGFILIMIGAVVAGAIAIFGPSDEACGSTEARGRNTELGLGARAETFSQGRGQGAGGQRQGQGQGQGLGRGQEQVLGQGQGRGRAEGTQSEATPQELETIEGLVVETDELVIETSSGETVQVGLGPSAYREAQGFVLETGENVRVSGYWEDDEFKATELENLTTGQSIVLRDATGRPMWAGQGRGRNRTS
jgi:hypothetical protein